MNDRYAHGHRRAGRVLLETLGDRTIVVDRNKERLWRRVGGRCERQEEDDGSQARRESHEDAVTPIDDRLLWTQGLVRNFSSRFNS